MYSVNCSFRIDLICFSFKIDLTELYLNKEFAKLSVDDASAVQNQDKLIHFVHFSESYPNQIVMQNSVGV